MEYQLVNEVKNCQAQQAQQISVIYLLEYFLVIKIFPKVSNCLSAPEGKGENCFKPSFHCGGKPELPNYFCEKTGRKLEHSLINKHYVNAIAPILCNLRAYLRAPNQLI